MMRFRALIRSLVVFLLFVGTLQGIVNQAGPKLYIRDYQHGVPIIRITNA
ncbi:hypothetical protein J4772_13075 [Cohnella sp. LGH]|nr:hypothetical protein [Cohnella sp. LGH]QTH45251.1 hypothetical protein J4772_13075 [Cohnella sp. LGH]